MIFIAHRGNIEGPNPLKENTIEYIDAAIKKGFDVEVDIWYKDWDFYLGHNKAEYKISMDQFDIRKAFLWCHAKDIPTLYKLKNMDVHCFFHNKDDCTFTSKGYIWTYPSMTLPITPLSICLQRHKDNVYFGNAYGVCSDYVLALRKIYYELERDDKNT